MKTEMGEQPLIKSWDNDTKKLSLSTKFQLLAIMDEAETKQLRDFLIQLNLGK